MTKKKKDVCIEVDSILESTTIPISKEAWDKHISKIQYRLIKEIKKNIQDSRND